MEVPVSYKIKTLEHVRNIATILISREDEKGKSFDKALERSYSIYDGFGVFAFQCVI